MEQGYKHPETVVFQDNQSALLLENNGHWSIGKRSKHISVRYFFIRDRIKNGDLKTQWCPTNQMIGDYFTKALQGSKVVEFRNEILNCGG